MTTTSRPRVICVDDEPHVVGGLALHLRRRYDVEVATSGPAALELLERAPAAVLITDMRMPGMNGAELLAKANASHPNTTRILLTGYSEVEAAVRAINEGQVFRMLVKPCPPPELLRVVDAAAELHRVRFAERELLEKTLRGSVQMLADVMAVTSPAAFGRATRVKQHVSVLVAKLGEPDSWQVEVAALLSQVGAITLPTETVDKLHYGSALSTAERTMVERATQVTRQLIGHIPRLEIVQNILAAAQDPSATFEELAPDQADVVRRSAQLLRGAIELDVLEGQGLLGGKLVEAVRGRLEQLDPEVLGALVELCNERAQAAVEREIPLSALQVGMVLVADVKLANGALFVARGYEVTESFLLRLRNFRPGSVREPLRVTLPKEA